MLGRWQGGVASLVVTALTVSLVTLDLTDDRFRHWWAERALATSTVAGVLVLMITVLVADQVVRGRQVKERSRATAAQAAILNGQAVRSTKAVSAALDGSGDQEAATDEVRTYMTMVMIAAPVLIDASQSRAFLEQAQRLGGELARAMSTSAKHPHPVGEPRTRIAEATEKLQVAAAPLLQLLDTEVRRAAGEGTVPE